VQAINSTVDILLVDNYLAATVQIEQHLAEIKSDLILQLTKIRDPDDISNLIQSEHPDLIFFIFNQSEINNLISLSRITEANVHDIPIILFTTELDIDLVSLSVDLDNYLILFLLSKNPNRNKS
jgi:DNA-binding NtrC family response regulator